MIWSNVFDYDPKTGNLLWRERRGKVKKGDVAGYVDNFGYIATRYKGKRRQAHRVIWEMFHGSIPKGMHIDHINHDKTDNRLENLRLTTPSQNAKNRKLYANNKSGCPGVFWDNYFGKWKAVIKSECNTIYLGHFNALRDAIAARKDAEIAHNFHTNHGMA